MTKKYQRPKMDIEKLHAEDQVVDRPGLESPIQTRLIPEIEEREALIRIAEFLFRNQSANA